MTKASLYFSVFCVFQMDSDKDKAMPLSPKSVSDVSSLLEVQFTDDDETDTEEDPADTHLNPFNVTVAALTFVQTPPLPGGPHAASVTMCCVQVSGGTSGCFKCLVKLGGQRKNICPRCKKHF